MFLNLVSACAYVWFLWPSRSAEALHTVDPLLGGVDSQSGMEEAYSYVGIDSGAQPKPPSFGVI
jgi:hypothetical protein